MLVKSFRARVSQSRDSKAPRSERFTLVLRGRVEEDVTALEQGRAPPPWCFSFRVHGIFRMGATGNDYMRSFSTRIPGAGTVHYFETRYHPFSVFFSFAHSSCSSLTRPFWRFSRPYFPRGNQPGEQAAATYGSLTVISLAVFIALTALGAATRALEMSSAAFATMHSLTHRLTARAELNATVARLPDGISPSIGVKCGVSVLRFVRRSLRNGLRVNFSRTRL